MPPFKIAIIGAGPAGCTLARLILCSNSTSQVTIFEGEISDNIRSQGGSLDLHDNDGLAAIRAAGLYDEFLKYARYDGSALKITDSALLTYFWKNGSTIQSADSRTRPEIDRVRLREILYHSLPEGVIHWGSRLRSIDADRTLHFDHGTESGFDLVVGADGAWSKVRPLLTDVKPQYSGISGHGLRISDAESRFPVLHKLVNRGSLFAFSNGHGITTQQLGDGSLSIAEWAVREESWAETRPYKSTDTEARNSAFKAEYSSWAPELVGFLQNADEGEVSLRTLYMLPVGHRWEHKSGTTMIGDAAHLMTPFAGVGVNIAMRDAMSLSMAILAAEQAGTTAALDEEVQHFEEDMFVRAEKAQVHTWANLNDIFLTEGAPRTKVENWVIRNGTADMAWPLKWATVVLVHVFYFFFKLIW